MFLLCLEMTLMFPALSLMSRNLPLTSRYLPLMSRNLLRMFQNLFQIMSPNPSLRSQKMFLILMCRGNNQMLKQMSLNQVCQNSIFQEPVMA